MAFNDRWLRLDTVNLFDGVIWIILAIAVGAPGISRLVNSEIGSKQSSGPKRVWACLALLSLFGYEMFRYNSHKDVIATLDSREYRGSPADAISVYPDTVGTLKWRALVESNDVYYEIPVLYNGYYDFNIASAPKEYKTGESKAIDAARKTRAFQIFEEFDQAPLWHLSPIGNVMKVELFDMRFGTFKRPGFTATANIAEDGHVIDSAFSLGR
jgi:inner membrane protein